MVFIRHKEVEKVEIEFDELIGETEVAWLVEIEGEEIWFPKSECDFEDYYLMVPEWLASQKGVY